MNRLGMCTSRPCIEVEPSQNLCVWLIERRVRSFVKPNGSLTLQERDRYSVKIQRAALGMWRSLLEELRVHTRCVGDNKKQLTSVTIKPLILFCEFMRKPPRRLVVEAVELTKPVSR